MRFQGRTVVITGASAGIGRAAASEFAREGANLALLARRRDRLESLQEELQEFPGTVHACPCDVSRRDRVEQAARTVLEKFPRIDVLVNNAGFAIYGAVSDLSIDDIESQMRTNYLGMVYCIKAFLPSMTEQKSGHIVNVASVAASMGLPGIAPYCASKSAMLGFSEGLKHELKGSGIGVTVVSPIMVRTDFFDHPSFAGMARYSPTSLDPKTVARAILRAARSPRLEIVVPQAVRAAVWARQTLPYVVDPLLARKFKGRLDDQK